MIVHCAGCGTRFNLADGQVPPQGARVRCSKCHHRFQVMPDGSPGPAGAAEPGDSAAAQDVASEQAAQAAQQTALPTPEPEPEPEPEPARQRAEAARPDPDLDNPEFLFDATPEPEAPAPPPPPPPRDASQVMPPEGFQTGAHDPNTSGVSEPAAQPVSPELGAVDDGQDVRSQVFGLDPGEHLDGSHEGEPDADSAERPASISDAVQNASELAAELADWDDSPEDGAPVSETEPAVPPVVGPSEQDRATRLRAETGASLRPSHPAGMAVRASAIALGLLLCGAGLRVLVTHGTGTPPGPEVLRANGWMATEVEARHLRDELGRRVLVLQGNLIPEEPLAAPRLEATLLDAAGNPLPADAFSVLKRFERQELGPGVLSGWLADGAGPPPATGPVTGFTVLVPDPPGDARRFRVDLLPPLDAI